MLQILQWWKNELSESNTGPEWTGNICLLPLTNEVTKGEEALQLHA